MHADLDLDYQYPYSIVHVLCVDSVHGLYIVSYSVVPEFVHILHDDSHVHATAPCSAWLAPQCHAIT